MITPADISFIMVMERKESVYPQAPLVGDKWRSEAWSWHQLDEGSDPDESKPLPYSNTGKWFAKSL